MSRHNHRKPKNPKRNALSERPRFVTAQQFVTALNEVTAAYEALRSTTMSAFLYTEARTMALQATMKDLFGPEVFNLHYNPHWEKTCKMLGLPVGPPNPLDGQAPERPQEAPEEAQEPETAQAPEEPEIVAPEPAQTADEDIDWGAPAPQGRYANPNE
jgi:hypothetical protein